MSWEKLNLYESKPKRVRMTTFMLILAVMVLPGVALRIYIESDWSHNVKLLNLKYLSVLKDSNLVLEGRRSDLAVLNSKAKEYEALSRMIVSQRKYLLEFFENAYLSKKFFYTIYESWRKDSRDWAVLSRLSFDLKAFSLEMYEIYTSGEGSLTSDVLEKKLKELFPKTTRRNVYDVEVFENLKLRRMVIKGAAPTNE